MVQVTIIHPPGGQYILGDQKSIKWEQLWVYGTCAWPGILELFIVYLCSWGYSRTLLWVIKGQKQTREQLLPYIWLRHLGKSEQGLILSAPSLSLTSASVSCRDDPAQKTKQNKKKALLSLKMSHSGGQSRLLEK